MLKIKSIIFPASLVAVLGAGLLFSSCDPDDDDDTLVYKPNIYLYPEENTRISLSLDFPLGGKVVNSFPEYGRGWEVNVDTSGLIDGLYTYLFYESIQPDVWQTSYGWVISREESESFFRASLEAYGFKGHEVEDFIDYWIPRLREHPYYEVFPQTGEIIRKVIVCRFSTEPDHFQRLFYAIKGYHERPDGLFEQAVVSHEFKREGFHALEWGVILK